MGAFTLADFSIFINENYLTYLILGGLLVVMLAYRDTRLPATKNFAFILVVIFLMSIANSLEMWSTFSPDREKLRVIASVIHYILQPFVFYLELVIIMPEADRKNRLRLFLISLPIIVNTLVYAIAPFTGGLVFCYDRDYHFTRGPLGGIIYIVTLYYLALLVYFSFLFLKGNDRRKSMILLFTAGIAILTGILEGLNIVTGYIDEAFALGLLLYYVYIITLHETNMQIALSKKELELSRNKVKLLREQIRPHFIFNSLHIIKSLIRTDQKRASLAVEDFSDYLQANLEAISSDRLISFDEELRHIKAYVSLALADSSKNITVGYDIQEKDFVLPPLCIEPLVENAIRHGVPKGGNVMVSSCSDSGNYIVRVMDDGKGFASTNPEEKEGTGIGIHNSRERLATCCGGTLDISGSNNGTTITVRIPRKKKGESDLEHSDRG